MVLRSPSELRRPGLALDEEHCGYHHFPLQPSTIPTQTLVAVQGRKQSHSFQNTTYDGGTVPDEQPVHIFGDIFPRPSTDAFHGW